MQCAYHAEAVATAYCSNCGTPLCSNCFSADRSPVLCAQCEPNYRSRLAAAQTSSPLGPVAQGRFPVPPLPTSSRYPYCPPVVSLLLGFIPGVGSVCNGDYFKAFLQVLIFGSLVSLSSSNENGDLGPMFGILTAAVYFYMPVDAYHVAKKRTLALQGIDVVTPFEKLKFPDLWMGCFAILAGAVFLINHFVSGTVQFVLRGWPLTLIGIGVYNLVRHFRKFKS